MLRRTLLPAALTAALLASPDVRALTERSDLEQWCTGASVAAAGRCIGYLLAAEDALASGPIEDVRACLPRGIGLNEQHALVLQWLRDHPDAVAPTALGLVARAYAKRYPC